MIGRFFRIILFCGLLAAVFWISSSCNQITLDAFGYHVEICSGFALLILFLGMICIHYLKKSLSALLGLATYFKKDTTSQTIAALYEFLLAVHTMNSLKSSHMLSKLKALSVPHNVLSVLNLELLTLQKDTNNLKSHLKTLSSNSETRTIGYRGLISLAADAENWGEVIEYGHELFKELQNEWLTSLMLKAYIKSNEWTNLVQFVQKERKVLNISKSAYSELIAVANYNIALKLYQDRQYNESYRLALDSYKSYPSLIPNLMLLTLLKLIDNDPHEAFKYITFCWKLTPAPYFINMIFQVAENHKEITSRQLEQLVHTCAEYHPDHYATYLLLAKYGLYVNNLSDIGNVLAQALSLRLTVSGCLLMIAYALKKELQEFDYDSWFKKANEADVDTHVPPYFWDLSSMLVRREHKDGCIIISMP
ncbi:hypothetical protein EDM53_01955 [Rickettsiales endosymbiont of Peranema trichophorum]|uniref:hypothetical protein n=1 Tax=Rickettsiales endosymbiont of Peranema trichophorum TaxID=2486577 RepID=UPI001023ABCF|nr:hypothetical protein [Rickettsiales endosymbiont of Peranema trichophorum]RZI47419.1 hypothetical protein EDM53_01955 [Rickettsiales endosymbiont of Peranema trichophorum]